MSPSPSSTLGARFEAFVQLIARLRAPGGCPWDREQTHETLKSMTLEEAYEVVEAIDLSDHDLAGELGDLLLQVVFHAQIASEAQRFTLNDVIDSVHAKMVRRHPHVFGGPAVRTPNEVLRNWEALKDAEREGKAPLTDEPPSMLEGVSRVLPAVMEAFQMATKVSRVGFDWPDAEGVFRKLEEEVVEVKEAVSRLPSSERQVSEEIGDLLFVAVNLARFLGVDPESALKASNRKFRRRFAHVEEQLRRRGRRPADSTLQEMESLWEEAKAKERRGE